MCVATWALGGRRPGDLVRFVIGELQEFRALDLLASMVGGVLGLSNNTLPVFVVQVGTDGGNPDIDSVSGAALVFLLVLHVETDAVRLDNNGGPFTGLVEKVVLLLAVLDPLVAGLLVHHGVLQTTHHIKDTGEGVQLAVSTKRGLLVLLGGGNVKVVPLASALVVRVEGNDTAAPILELVVPGVDKLLAVNNELQRTVSETVGGLCTTARLNHVLIDNIDHNLVRDLTAKLALLEEAEANTRDKLVGLCGTLLVFLDSHVPLEGRSRNGRVPRTRSAVKLEELSGESHDERISIDATLVSAVKVAHNLHLPETSRLVLLVLVHIHFKADIERAARGVNVFDLDGVKLVIPARSTNVFIGGQRFAAPRHCAVGTVALPVALVVLPVKVPNVALDAIDDNLEVVDVVVCCTIPAINLQKDKLVGKASGRRSVCRQRVRLGGARVVLSELSEVRSKSSVVRHDLVVAPASQVVSDECLLRRAGGGRSWLNGWGTVAKVESGKDCQTQIQV